MDTPWLAELPGGEGIASLLRDVSFIRMGQFGAVKPYGWGKTAVRVNIWCLRHAYWLVKAGDEQLNALIQTLISLRLMKSSASETACSC
ncbi:hypothetical protein D7I41_06310 [Ochrobactrum sp. MH181795]|nr:hypothetical protein D7I41_06310 [Ochrobactrum sp. MH181795]